MRVIVCGGRDYNNEAYIWRTLDKFYSENRITHLMQGGAKGVDRIANQWAMTKPITRYTCKADWNEHGKGAGPIRNSKMLEWKPDLIIAFPGGKGTADMVNKARNANIKVIEIT